jgi:hypothetical protein
MESTAVHTIRNDLSHSAQCLPRKRQAQPVPGTERTGWTIHQRTSSGRRNNDVLHLSSNVLRLIPVRAALLVGNAIHHDARTARRQRCNRRANHHRCRYANRYAHCHWVRVPTIVVVVIVVVVMIIIIVMMVIVVVTVVVVVIAATAVVVTVIVVVIAAAAVVTASTAATAVVIASTAAATAVTTTVVATTAVTTATAATVAAMAYAAARMRPPLRATARAAGMETTTASAAMKTSSWRRVNTRARAAAETKRVNAQRGRKKDPGNPGNRKLFGA